MKYIAEDFISFETAKLAKEKGFSWHEEENSFFMPRGDKVIVTEYLEGVIPTHGYRDCYEENGKSISPKHYKYSNSHYPKPTQALLAKWLREKHNIHIHIARRYKYLPIPVEFSGWCIYIDNGKQENLEINNFFLTNFCKSHEDALEKGLYESLKFIQDEQKKS